MSDYLDKISWSDALDRAEAVAQEHPEMAPRMLAWLVEEARYALLGQKPAQGSEEGWFRPTSARWPSGDDEPGRGNVSE